MTIYNLKYALLYIFASSSFYSAIASDDLDAVLLRDIMPSRGSKCEAGANSYTGQTSSYTFQHYRSPAYWDPTAAPFEPQVFQAEMSNVNAADPDKSWTIRVGSGGNIYSFRGPFFEAIPPQYHTDGEWVDEVTQSVAVNLAQNGDSDYYMHQAGIYTKDGPHTDQPFFSPSIAKHCSDKECFFASWGQQAHTPTKHISNTIYFNGYRDCGDGIIEFTTIIHNSANSPNLYTDYHNTPWGGTRSTNLRDIFISSPDGSMSQKYPLANWSNDPNTIQNLNSSGGYTTFTQQVVVEESVYNSRPPYQMPVSNGVSLELTVNGNAVKSNWHSDTYGLHCMRLPVIATFGTGAGCSFCNFELENARTGAKVFVPAVIHWSWQGTNMYLCLPSNSVSSQFNDKFNPGDKILVAYANIGKPHSENKALSVIHGKQRAWGEWSPTNRVRYGVAASSARRNYNVYTTNTRRKIRPGSTYIYTQYIASGRLLEMESTGNAWEPQVYEDIYDETEKIGDGTTIQLYSADMNTFGAYVDGVNQCLQGSSVCTGNSLPEFNKIPLFYITCGSNTYVGSNKYHFSPPRANVNQNIRSYVCNGENSNVRPTWKLLGYFEDESCSALQAATYDATFCPRPPPTGSPTESPTPSPTGSPTPSPTPSPTESPTPSPTESPTPSPTPSPTDSPTESPTGSPTPSPTGSPTPSPTESPTGSPTPSPTGSPTPSPTESPTGSPTPSPTESPTPSPTESPTGSPTPSPTESPTPSPTESPTGSPTPSPTGSPTPSPTESPTGSPTPSPTESPTPSPTESPTGSPTPSPTESPTPSPTESPTGSPTPSPTGSPTPSPTESPTGSPTPSPTGSPTPSPTGSPTPSPSESPTGSPTPSPTESPTGSPAPSPTGSPTPSPTESPTSSPTGSPTGAPTEETECNADESYFSIEIQLDRKAHQNAASLQKKNEVTGKWVKIFRVNTFGTNQLFQWGQCMNKNTCYRFNIADSARDGICCEHGQGYFEVKFDDQRKFNKFKNGRRRRRTIGDCGSNKNGNFTDFGTDDFDDDFDDGLGSEGTEVSALKSYDFFGTLSEIFDAIVDLLLALVGSTP